MSIEIEDRDPPVGTLAPQCGDRHGNVVDEAQPRRLIRRGVREGFGVMERFQKALAVDERRQVVPDGRRRSSMPSV